ncbi:MAG TPA: alpha/beta hydrolase, partial [Polyangiaceae bacterium]
MVRSSAHATVIFGLSVALAAGVPACRNTSAFTRENALEKVRGEHPDASLPADELPAGVIAHEELVYSHASGRELRLDVYAPARAGRHPGVLVVHGGGWESGSRTMERPFAKRLAARGYVTAPVSYRLGPDGRYPNALYDLKQAVRWLRANAERFGIDAANLGAVGGSAGGQLVALLGATNGEARLEGDGETKGVSSEIQAVVDLDGLADFTGKALLDKEARDPGAPTHFLGGSFADRAATWRDASPITHAGNHSAPTLFVESGAPRPILPGRHEMCAKLLASGVDCSSITMSGAP